MLDHPQKAEEKTMNIRNHSFVTTLSIVFFSLFWHSQSLATERLQRGEYLVNFGGCHDCHSPKIFTDNGPTLDPQRLLSGHPSDTELPALPDSVIAPDKWGAVATHDLTAWFGPWGVSFAINLTPDPNTGLGNWKESQFIQAMRTGKHLGTGRPILPPMPWFALAALNDDDLRAIFAYLGSIKAIENRVPSPIPPPS